MAAVLKAAKEQLICHLCQQVLTEPKTLNCMHSFCKKCIQQYMDHTTKGQKSPAGFLCPDCKQVMPLSHLSGNNAEMWASELPTNEALKSILKAFQTSGEEIAIKCAFHAEKDVEFYCEDHDMLLCSLCATLTHKPCSDVVTLAVAATRRKAEGGKFINFLSEQITMSEKVLSDRKEQLVSLDRSETEIKNQLTQLKKKMIDYLDNMENKIIQELSQRKLKEMHALKSDLDVCNGLLGDATQSLKTIQNSIEKDSAANFVIRFKEQVVLFDDRQSRLTRFVQTLKNTKISFHSNKTLEQAVLHGKAIGTLSAETTPSRLANVYGKAAPIETQKTITRQGTGKSRPYSGVTSAAPTPRTVRSTTDMPSFRKPMIPKQIRSREHREPIKQDIETKSLMSEASSRISELKPPNDLTQSKAMELSSIEGKTITAKLKAEFNASVPDQKECSIEGAAILKSGHVVLSDSYHSSLKLFDAKFQYIGLIKFATSPGDVCAIGDSEVVVCLPDTMRLKHEKIESNKIVPGEVLTVGDKCHSVAFNNGTLACCSGRTIHVFARDKHSWQRISTTPMDADNLMYIAVDPNGERIVVTRNGYPNRPVVCLSKNGQKVWSYTHEELRLPRGVAFLGFSVLVVSWDQQKVIQLNRDGQLEGVVLQQGVQWPWKLSISPKGDKLMLTQCYYRLPFKDKNCVKIFKIIR